MADLQLQAQLHGNEQVPRSTVILELRGLLSEQTQGFMHNQPTRLKNKNAE